MKSKMITFRILLLVLYSFLSLEGFGLDNLSVKIKNPNPSDTYFITDNKDSLLYFQVVFLNNEKSDSIPVFYGKIPLNTTVLSDSLADVLNGNFTHYFDYQNIKYIGKDYLFQLNKEGKIIGFHRINAKPYNIPNNNTQFYLKIVFIFFNLLTFIDLFWFLFFGIDSGKKRFIYWKLWKKIALVLFFLIVFRIFSFAFLFGFNSEQSLYRFLKNLVVGLSILFLFISITNSIKTDIRFWNFNYP